MTRNPIYTGTYLNNLSKPTIIIDIDVFEEVRSIVNERIREHKYRHYFDNVIYCVDCEVVYRQSLTVKPKMVYI